MNEFKTFSEFATEEVITRLLVKERAKFTIKNKKARHEKKNSIYIEQLKPMMPPRFIWVNPSKFHRPRKASTGPASWTRPRKLAELRIWDTIQVSRRKDPNAPWLLKLDLFVKKIRGIVIGTEPFIMEAPKIGAKFKEEKEDGVFIYRPICSYTSLETKIILALTYKYILEVLDDCFHANMMFMRTSRVDKNGNRTTPDCMKALKRVDAYRKRYPLDKPIYVGECDIQKFYDILNHDDILECFDRLFEEKSKRLGIDVSELAPARHFLEMYLDSFDYYHNVYCLNDDAKMWKAEKQRRMTSSHPDPVCRFNWVSDEAFIASGCYDAQSLEDAKKNGLLGVPQGGALSGIIVNVVMQCIDDDIVRPADPDRLFIRYCDDILLMHTDEDRCKEYLDIYFRNLKAHKLVRHEPIHVGDEEFKKGARTLKTYWKKKSKYVYRWGKGEGDANYWVSFLGHEFGRDGEIRFRKDKIDSTFRHISHRYFQVIHSKTERVVKQGPSGKRVTEPVPPEKRIGKFRGVNKHFETGITTWNRYTKGQMRRLDKYLFKKAGKAARVIKAEYPRDLPLYRSKYAEVKKFDAPK